MLPQAISRDRDAAPFSTLNQEHKKAQKSEMHRVLCVDATLSSVSITQAARQTRRKPSWSSGPGPQENAATARARQLRLQGSQKEGCGCAIIMVKRCQELRGCVLNSETHIPVTSCVGHTGVS